MLDNKYTEWYIPLMGKAERTKKYIIEKSSPVFNRKGYHGTSLSDLTHATKLTKGSIYGNFKNKDDLAANCFLFNVSKITDIIKEKLAGAENTIEKLSVFPNTYRMIYETVMQNGGCPVANTLIEADDTHPELTKLAIAVIHDWESKLVSIIEEGRASGEINSTTNPLKTSQIMISLLEGGMVLAKSTGNDAYILNAIEQVENMIDSLQG